MKKVYLYDGITLVEFAGLAVAQGHYGDLPCGVIAAIDLDLLAIQLEGDGYHETPLGVVYTGDEPFGLKGE